MKKIIAFLKEHKDFIIFIISNIRGSVRLRALKCYFGFLLLLCTGLGFAFVCNSFGQWTLEVSYATIGKGELIIGILGTIVFYIWLYYDNKSKFNNTVSGKLDNIGEGIDQILRSQEAAAILPFYTFAQFEKQYNEHNVLGFVDTDELCIKRNIITEQKFVRILALSGTGKTFLILKAFREQGNIDNVFYCETVNDSRFKDAITYIAENKPEATIILDNCPSKISNMVIEAFGNKLRIISAYFDPNDKDNYSNVVDFSDCNIPSIIDCIISNNATRQMPISQKEFIKYHSGNIPLMALLLTQAFNKNGAYYDIHDNRLMENLLDIDGVDKEYQRIAMRTIALFQPLEFNDGESLSAKYIIESDYFTPIVSQINRKLLFQKVVEKLYKRSLIEKDSIFINMRPQPLACWLVGEWLREQGPFISRLISDILQQPKTLHNSIVEAWAKRLEFMQGNHDAEDLYSELLEIHGGPFCNEDVICSDFGSRLILAMCTVNPVAVVNCLYSILYTQSIDFLKDKLIGDARRNIVRTLEKLCFCDDCFEKAACLMARLAVAENEAWANNAHGQFLQLFHIALAGTESDLNARISVIQKLHSEGVEYNNLLLDAIKGAFNSSNLVRMGGAEKFGFIEKSDFHPTWNQISEYWDNLYDFLKDWIEKEPELTKTIAEIICSNTRMLIHSRRPDLLFKFIDLLAPQLNYHWNEMHKALVETKNYDKVTSEIGEKILFWLEKLTPQDTIGRMKNALHDMYTKFDRGVDIIQQEKKVVLPFAEEFISNKAYLSEEVFQLLDQNNGYISWAFDEILAKNMPEGDIATFCDYIKGYIYKQGKKFYSSFLVSIFGKLNEKQLVWPFAHQLFDEGYIDIAIPIFAVTDDNVRSKLSFVMQKVSEGVIEKSNVRKYLSAIRLNKASDIFAMAVQLEKCGADMPLLFDHISYYWYLDECYTNTELVHLYQKVILNYPLKDNNNFNNEFVYLVKSLLNKNFDFGFAKSLNVKLIKYLSFNESLFHVEEIYEVLLTDKYRDYIWADFSKALTDFDNRIGFFINVKYTIGSGFEFGEKILFSGHIEQMKQLCRDFKYGALVCAATCPIFDTVDSDTGAISSFHSFAIWLIENYGNQKQVLDEFHANLNTFSCTGSSIPLIEDRKRCFENLKQYKNLPENVYSWIDSCLKENLNDYKREEQHEAYMRLAYGKR